MELTGRQNPVVKAAAELKQKKYHPKRFILAEGLRTAEEAVAQGSRNLFYVATDDDRTMQLFGAAAMQTSSLFA